MLNNQRASLFFKFLSYKIDFSCEHIVIKKKKKRQARLFRVGSLIVDLIELLDTRQDSTEYALFDVI